MKSPLRSSSGARAARAVWSLALLTLLVVTAPLAHAKKAMSASPSGTGKAADYAAVGSEAGDAFSDEETGPGTYRLRTLLQTRFTRTAVDVDPIEQRLREQQASRDTLDYTRREVLDRAQSNDGFDIQRAFLRATAQPTAAFGAKLLVDFSELYHKSQKNALKLAYGQLRATREITITAGLFKIPFSLLELLPIADFELADVGPTDNLIKDVGFGGRDIGAMVDVAPLAKRKLLQFSLGVFDGDNHDRQRHPGPGIIAGRVRVRPFSHLEVAFDCAARPYSSEDVDDAGTHFEKFSSGAACSTDASFSFHHFALRAEWMTGKRTDAPLFPDKRKHNFSAAWGIALYRMRLRGALVLMPAARIEWLDEDQPSAIGRTLLVSGALNLEFSRATRLLFDLSRYQVQAGSKDRQDIPFYRPSTTTGVVQVQYEL